MCRKCSNNVIESVPILKVFQYCYCPHENKKWGVLLRVIPTELSVSESKLLFIQNGKKHEKIKKEIKKGKEHRLFFWSAVNSYFTC